METEKSKSPCIKVCKLDSSKICIGCKRSQEEIKNWSKMSVRQREIVNERIKNGRQ